MASGEELLDYRVMMDDDSYDADNLEEESAIENEVSQ